jgi:hypothetical protein
MKRSSNYHQCDLFRILICSGMLVITGLFSIQSTYGQDVQWATKLLGFSSELRLSNRGYDYRAKQILGAPNKLPDIGDSPCAWSPAKINSNADEWIKVGFQKPTLLRQVAIAENLNQGAISQVYAYTADGKELLIYKNTQAASGPNGKMLRIFPENPIANVDAIKVVIDPSRTPGYNQIDAIGISGSTTPIQAKINVSPNATKITVKENLGKNVNSKGQEVAPVISPDGKTLYFTRSKHPGNTGVPEKQDIWQSSLDNSNKWSPAINLGGPINNAGDNAMAGIASDGKTVYLINVYLPNGQMANGLSKSTKTGDGWSFPKECKILNHYNLHRANYTEFAISPQENVMILSVERNDTEGNKDLYVSFLKPGAEIWSEPINMGTTLNTADYEGAPFIASDNKSTVTATSSSPAGWMIPGPSGQLQRTWVL